MNGKGQMKSKTFAFDEKRKTSRKTCLSFLSIVSEKEPVKNRGLFFSYSFIFADYSIITANYQ